MDGVRVNWIDREILRQKESFELEQKLQQLKSE
jgi:hypothetical protein